MKTFDTVLRARIEIPKAKRFNAIAKSKNMKPSEFLRQIVMLVIGENSPEELKIKPVEGKDVIVNKSISLPRFLVDEIDIRAKSKGMKFSRWIAALIQSNLMRDTVLSTDEIQMLNASNRELAAIGRNLNQIAKALNERFHETDRIKLEHLNELNKAIEQHDKTIRRLIRASQQSWEALNELD